MPIGLATPAAAQIQQAFRDWPKGSIEAMQRLGLEYPKDPVVQYYRGVALLWAGYPNDAVARSSCREEARPGHDLAGAAPTCLLHPQLLPPANGSPYPVFSPDEH